MTVGARDVHRPETAKVGKVTCECGRPLPVRDERGHVSCMKCGHEIGKG